MQRGAQAQAVLLVRPAVLVRAEGRRAEEYRSRRSAESSAVIRGEV